MLSSYEGIYCSDLFRSDYSNFRLFLKEAVIKFPFWSWCYRPGQTVQVYFLSAEILNQPPVMWCPFWQSLRYNLPVLFHRIKNLDSVDLAWSSAKELRTVVVSSLVSNVPEALLSDITILNESYQVLFKLYLWKCDNMFTFRHKPLVIKPSVMTVTTSSNKCLKWNASIVQKGASVVNYDCSVLAYIWINSKGHIKAFL